MSRMGTGRSGAVAGAAATAAIAAVMVAGCGTNNNAGIAGDGGGSVASRGSTAPVSCDSGRLNGAGSSFQAPMQQSWLAAYGGRCNGAQVNYQAVGSGSGIQQFGAGTVDFAGSDVTMKPHEQQRADRRCAAPAIHIPVTAGGVGITYNLAGVTSLKLSPDTLAGIFQGTITKWDAPAIMADNKGVALPGQKITVFHRSDSSGTNAVFTSYMDGASGAWKLGSGKTVAWPVGVGKPQNQGVSAAVKQTPGGITYTEQAFATQRKLPLARIRNEGGHYVTLTAQHVSTALQSIKIDPKGRHDLSVKIDYRPTDANAYPISTVSYVIVCSAYPKSFTRADLLKHYLDYAVNHGQDAAGRLGFAPLPQSIVDKDKSAIASIS